MEKLYKKIFINQYCGYGDWISVSGMARFLATKYEEVNIIGDGGNYNFISDLYKDKSRIKVIGANEMMEYINCKNDWDYLDLKTGDSPSTPTVENHYNMFNQLGLKLGLPAIQIDPNWFRLEGDPCQFFVESKPVLENNAAAFYCSAGIPKNYRLDYFYYERNIESENNFFESLNLPEKYIVISEYGNNLLNRKFIKNKDLYILNINDIAQNYFDVIKVIENAEEVHLLENSTALISYHLQYKNLMKQVEIQFHTYGRREPARKCISEDSSNIFMDMMTCPKLKNWNFIYENDSKSDMKKIFSSVGIF